MDGWRERFMDWEKREGRAEEDGNAMQGNARERGKGKKDSPAKFLHIAIHRPVWREDLIVNKDRPAYIHHRDDIP